MKTALGGYKPQTDAHRVNGVERGYALSEQFAYAVGVAAAKKAVAAENN